MLRSSWYLVKTTLAVYLTFYKLIFFWNLYHIFRICNEINNRNIWFPKVIIILIMTAQAFFFNVFSEKAPHLNAIKQLTLLSNNLALTSYLSGTYLESWFSWLSGGARKHTEEKHWKMKRKKNEEYEESQIKQYFGFKLYFAQKYNLKKSC